VLCLQRHSGSRFTDTLLHAEETAALSFERVGPMTGTRRWRYAWICCVALGCTDLGIVGRVCPQDACQPTLRDGGTSPPDSGKDSGATAVTLAGASGGVGVSNTGGQGGQAGQMVSEADAGPNPSGDDGGLVVTEPCDPGLTTCTYCTEDSDCGNNLLVPYCDVARSTCSTCPIKEHQDALALRLIACSIPVSACYLLPQDKSNTDCFVNTCGNYCRSD